MPNKTYALEWINLAYKNMETARLLIRENHFTDSIAIEVHQTIEKSFKAIYAYLGITIPRTHSLMLLFNFIREHIQIKDINSEDLIAISDYYETDRYPGPKYTTPSRNEVEEHFKIAEIIFYKIKTYILH
jgi:HEPN domain-containing protein